MCTVTFIPLHEKGFLLTSNRDEKTTRPEASPPFTEKRKNYIVMYPKDPKGGGSWIAIDNRQNAVCLLNGANERHQPEYPYRHSRGLIVLDVFEYGHFFDFFDFYDLDNIEPFTLVAIQNFSLYEFRWDGKNRNLKDYSFNQPMIWSSVTLYDTETIRKREKWFYSWMRKESSPDIEEALHFHRFAGEGDKKTDLVMEHSKELRTLSITSAQVDNKQARMVYRDLVRDSEHEEILIQKK